MRIPYKFHLYSICNVSFKFIRFHARHLISGLTHIELYKWRCCYQQRWLRYPQKQSQQRWICFRSWFTPFDSLVTKFIKKNHPHFYFRCRNSITSWTISKISTSRFDSTRNTPKRTGKFRRATEIFNKNEGCRFCTTAVPGSKFVKITWDSTTSQTLHLQGISNISLRTFQTWKHVFYRNCRG